MSRAPSASVAKTSAAMIAPAIASRNALWNQRFWLPRRAPSALSTSRFVGVVARGRLVVTPAVLGGRLRRRAQPLVLVDQQQDRATRRA